LLFVSNQSPVSSIIAYGAWHLRDLKHKEKILLTQAFVKMIKPLC
jgi:hypothetical protein